MNLDPQIAPLIEALDAGFPPVHTMTGAQARATIRCIGTGLLRPSSIGQVSIGRAATEVAAVSPIFASTGP